MLSHALQSPPRDSQRSLCAAAPTSNVQAEDLPYLLQVLKENVGLSGNIVRSLETQKKIAELGKREPKAVVPVIVRELKAPRSPGRKALDYRMALISVLEEMRPRR